MKNNIIKKLFVFVFFIAIFSKPGLGAQEIVTAENYLAKVSDVYSTFKDYEGKIKIISGGSSEMTGDISYRTPEFLRIDFSNPAGQVIVFNGEMLTVYLPEYKAALNQAGSSGSGMGLATGNGLALLRRNFGASFVTGPEPEPLDEGSGEMVVKIKLIRRYGSEGFREIILSIDPKTLLIRRMRGTTLTNNVIQFDFSNIKTNIGIPEQRFIYDSPASANVYNNFLLRETN